MSDSSVSLSVASDPAARDPAHGVSAQLVQCLPALEGFVRRQAGQVLRSKESTDDLVQSVCREILEHIDQFRHPDGDGFRRWLYTTAKRKLLEKQRFYRRDRRDVAREASPGNAPEVQALDPSPSRVAVAQEDVDTLSRAFHLLPESQARVIFMARVLGLSRAEIADELGRSEGAVRTLLWRALAKLALLMCQVRGPEA